MRVFSSWSGGKDCMLALHRALATGEHQLVALLNMCDLHSGYSRSHGLKKELLQRQAEAMNFRLVQQGTTNGQYEKDFKAAILRMKEEDRVEAGVFGDIYLMEHREWIERVCADLDIVPLFPLWGDKTEELAYELVDAGFQPLVVSVRESMLSKDFLGRIYNREMIEELRQMNGIDICAENGEFHSFVIDGPLFSKPVQLEKGKIYFEDKHWFLELN